MSVYIQSAAQISVQNPLCDDWLTDPIALHLPLQRAIEADYKRFLDPMASRRMGRTQTCLATAVTVVENSGIEQPDAYLLEQDWDALKIRRSSCWPCYRMEKPCCLHLFYQLYAQYHQLSIAIHLACHAYNSTYVHLGISFESALLDAFMQFQLGRIRSALLELMTKWFLCTFPSLKSRFGKAKLLQKQL